MLKVCGSNDYLQLVENSNNKSNHGSSIIFPPIDLRIDLSNILSFSVYHEHSIWITRDGLAHTIGDNSSGQICRSINKENLKKVKIFSINSKGKQPYKLISAVCGASYTLYLALPSGGKCNQLLYNSKRQEDDQPLLLNIENRNPIGLFGGRATCAAIDSEGKILFISKKILNSPKAVINPISLPNNEKSIYVACCIGFVIALSSNGKVYSSSLSKDGELTTKFMEVPELSGIKIIDISGSYEHCLAVSVNGKVFGRGSNAYGQLGIGDDQRKDEFSLIQAFKKQKIVSSYAGYTHSLFLTSNGKIFACGSNSNGETIMNKGPSDPIFSPKETIIANATYCIAGDELSAVFVNCEPPPNCPNRKITENLINQMKLLTEAADPAQLEITKLKQLLQQKEKEISQLKKEKETLKKDKDSQKKTIDDLQSKLAKAAYDVKKSTPTPKEKPDESNQTNDIKFLTYDELKQYQEIGSLGRGATSQVFKVSNQFYALKVIYSDLIRKPVDATTKYDDEVELDYDKLILFFKEYEVLNSLHHPNIIKAFGFYNGDKMHDPSILLEYCPHNLSNWLDKLDSAQSITIIIEIVDAMSHVHSRGIFHRDLKPANILLDSEMHVKISDFGLCALSEPGESSISRTQGVGTFRFMAPEILNNMKNYDHKVDIYSFGLVFYVILTKGKYPNYNGVDISKGEIPPIDPCISSFSRKLIQKCWSFDPRKRPSFSEIYESLKVNRSQIFK